MKGIKRIVKRVTESNGSRTSTLVFIENRNNADTYSTLTEERAIRYIQIDDYETLYESLRANMKQTNSVSALRNKLRSCKQEATETVQNFNVRYRQIVNEVKYAEQGRVFEAISP